MNEVASANARRKCEFCKGDGWVGGIYPLATATCPKCKGTGYDIAGACQHVEAIRYIRQNGIDCLCECGVLVTTISTKTD